MTTMLIKFKTRFVLITMVMLALMWLTLQLLNSSSNRPNGRKSSSSINLNELFHVGDCLLKQAGKEIVKMRKETRQSNDENNLNIAFKKKADNSLVTAADLKSHTIIVHSLNQKFPQLKVNSEENNQNDYDDAEAFDYYLSVCDNYEKTSYDLYANVDDINVWVDPLDATQEYSENLVQYVTVMFCIVDKNTPRAGIIHSPFMNKTVSSFYERKNLKQSSDNPSRPRITVSRSHSGSVKSIISEKLTDYELIIAAGSGYKTTSLIDQTADLYFHSSNIYKWDICAPNAILNNLGGKLAKRNGEQVDYFSADLTRRSVDGIIASLYYYDYFFDIFKS